MFDVDYVTVQQNVRKNTAMDSIDSAYIPKKRGQRAKYVSLMICIITIIPVTIFFLFSKENVYTMDVAQKNTTDCYRKTKTSGFSDLLQGMLGFFGVVIGTVCDRLSLLAEELFHVRERHKGSFMNMTKACISVIKWPPVFTLLLLTFLMFLILIISTGRSSFELRYVIYVASGICVGPLIMYVLKLNTDSKFYLSVILEREGINVGSVLAWSYYFTYLKPAAQIFQEARFRFDAGLVLSFHKLLLLIPLNYPTTDDLLHIDNHIKEFPSNEHPNRYPFPIYQLRIEENEARYFAIQYIQKPLEALRSMTMLKTTEASNINISDEEVKLFYRTLSEILTWDKDIKEKCLLVPIKTESPESLINGGLVKCIMAAVDRSRIEFAQAKENRLTRTNKHKLPKQTKRTEMFLCERQEVDESFHSLNDCGAKDEIPYNLSDCGAKSETFL